MTDAEDQKNPSTKTRDYRGRKAFSYILVMAILTSLATLALFYFKSPLKQEKTRLIAITQIVPHASLDLIRKGIVDTLTDKEIQESEIVFENAMGNIAMANQISQRLISLKPTLIVPITTPSAQAAVSAAKKQKIPVIFAAVSDPVGAKLLDTMAEPNELVTGVCDLSPLKEQLILIKQVLPKIKRLGIVYNAGEINSVVLTDQLSKLCEGEDIIIIRAVAASAQEVSSAVRNLVGHVDAIYIPNDNTVVSALPALLQVAQDAKIPVFSADPESVERGCLGTVAHNQYALGQQVGQMILAYINGTPFSQIKPTHGQTTEIVLNTAVAEDLGIDLPVTLIKRATKIIERKQIP